MEIAFLSVVLGLPLALGVLAVIGAHFHGDDDATLIDWKPTRSAETEARLTRGEADQLLAAVNRYRRRRGAPERSLEELTSAEREREVRRRPSAQD